MEKIDFLLRLFRLQVSYLHPIFMAFVGRDFLLVSTGTSEYTLTKEDVGRVLAFIYIPINFEGMSTAFLNCSNVLYMVNILISQRSSCNIIIGIPFRAGRGICISSISRSEARYLLVSTAFCG